MSLEPGLSKFLRFHQYRIRRGILQIFNRHPLFKIALSFLQRIVLLHMLPLEWIRVGIQLPSHSAKLRSLESQCLFLLLYLRCQLSQIHPVFAGLFSKNLQIGSVSVVLPNLFFRCLGHRRIFEHGRDILRTNFDFFALSVESHLGKT